MVSTYGILFMGTPHQVSEEATWDILAQNMTSIFANTNNEILNHLSRNSKWLDYQQSLFLPISNRFETIYFSEAYPTPTPGGGHLLVCPPKTLGSKALPTSELTVTFQVVPKHSACILGAADAARIAISSDHISMVKFKSAKESGFRIVYGELFIMLKKALQKIKENRDELTSVKHAGR